MLRASLGARVRCTHRGSPRGNAWRRHDAEGCAYRAVIRPCVALLATRCASRKDALRVACGGAARARRYLVSGGGVAPFAGEVVAEMLTSGAQAAHVEHLRADLSAGCGALCSALSAAGSFEFETPCGGYFVWVRLPEGVGAAALLPVAERHGVTFLPGATCAPTAPADACDRYIRLCFAWCAMPDLVEGVRRLKAAVKEMQGATA